MTDFSSTGLDDIEELITRAVTEGQVPGVVVGLARGESVHVFAAGDATIGGPAMAGDTLMRLSSLTKPMVAAAALSQVADGLVDLDDPIDAWIPELAARRVLRSPRGPIDDTVPAQRPVTVRDLLTSTFGIGMHGALFAGARPWPVRQAADDRGLGLFDPPMPRGRPDPDTWVARLGELPLMLQPGQGWLYQTSSTVLGVLIGRIDGSSLPEALRRRVFDPLGLTDTGFVAADPARVASLYARTAEGLTVLDGPGGQWSSPPDLADGAGGLVGTADEVVKFGRMLLRDGGRVLPAPAVRAMTSNQLTTTQRHVDWDGFSFLGDRGWGYGVSVLPDRYQWEGGFGAVWCNVPADDLTVVVLAQRLTDQDGPPPVLEDTIAAARRAVA